MFTTIEHLSFRSLVLAVALLGGWGCAKGGETSPGQPESGRGDVSFRVVRAKQLVGLAVLEKQGGLEKALAPLGVRVEWIEFAAGPQQLEALSAGALDLAQTAESPPIFAQAAGSPLVYLAATHQNGKLVSLLVPSHSSARCLADLKGRRVAVQKASIGHYLLMKGQARDGLPPNSIEAVYLPPPDANAAFARAAVDGWFIWEPFVTRNVQSGHGRVLLDGEGLRDTRNFFTTRRAFAQAHPEILRIFLEELQKAEAWAASHALEMSELLSPVLGIGVATLQVMHAKTQFGVLPVSEAYMDEQQRTAELWFSLGLLPKPVHARDGLLTHSEFEASVPVGLRRLTQ